VDNTLLDFGNLDPTAPVAASVNNSNLEFACSTGVNYAITDDDGLNELGPGQPQLADGAGEFIPYTLSYVGAGVGTGVATNLNVQADIAAGVYATNSPGVYNDTVTLTINP
jgi:spore coat protein U-like protein